MPQGQQEAISKIQCPHSLNLPCQFLTFLIKKKGRMLESRYTLALPQRTWHSTVTPLCTANSTLIVWGANVPLRDNPVYSRSALFLLFFWRGKQISLSLFFLSLSFFLSSHPFIHLSMSSALPLCLHGVFICLSPSVGPTKGSTSHSNHSSQFSSRLHSSPATGSWVNL